jgi:hypothetical protein
MNTASIKLLITFLILFSIIVLGQQNFLLQFLFALKMPSSLKGGQDVRNDSKEGKDELMESNIVEPMIKERKDINRYDNHETNRYGMWICDHDAQNSVRPYHAKTNISLLGRVQISIAWLSPPTIAPPVKR